MKRMFSLMLAAAMVLALAGCAGKKGEAGDSFRFGACGPLTGDAAIYGKAVMNGAQIAVDEINAMGGAKIALNAQDDEADGEKAVNAYNSLMDWGMQVLVGPVTTGASITVSAKAFEDRTFCMTPSASSTDVTAGKDNVFQLCFTDPNQGSGAASYIAGKLPGRRIAVIYRNDDAYSQGIRDTFCREALTQGLEIVYEGTFTKDTQTDFSVQLGKAQSEGADLLFLPIYYQPASVILAQAKSMNYAPVFFGVDGMDGILTMEGFDTSLAEGVMLLTPFAADADDAKTKSFVEEYQKRFKEVPNQFAADGYDTVYALYNALLSAGCTPDMSAPDICARLIPQLQSTGYDGLTGKNMTWNTSGEVTKTPVAVVIRNGVYVSA
ncbi:MAG: ABC transporter substrate-binding protein [Oscillospiraceae bacterium]|nr:ABC transporter substrate-binding protein [Oscillospiraceae bacterium]